MSNKNFAAGFRQVLADEKVKKSTAALINAKQITSEAPVVAPKAPKAPKAPEPPEASKTQETPKAPEITKTPETPKVPITPTVPKARGHNALLITAISSVVIFAGAAAFAYYQLNKPVAFIASSEQSLSESIDTDKDSNPKQKTEQESATDKVEKQEDPSQSPQDSQSTNPQDDTQNSNDKPASDSSNAKTDQTQNLGSVIGSNASALTPKNNNSNSSASSRTGQHSSSTSPNTDDVHANKTNNSQGNNSQTNNSQQQQQQQQQQQNNSGQNNSSQNNQNNQNNQTGKTDKEPKVTYKQLYAAFYANYATLDGLRTDRLLRTCTTPSTEMSCEVTAPSIQRDGFEIIGYGTAPDARESILAPGQTITITDSNSTFYALTKKTVTATFVFPRGGDPQTQSCEYYNAPLNQISCKIVFPEYEQLGSFQNTWSQYETLSSPLFKSGENVYLNNDKTYYASYHHVYYMSEAGNHGKLYKDRDLEIQRVYYAGPAKFEYQAGIPANVIDNHIEFLKTAYATSPWVFVPSKNFVLMPETYEDISLAYGVTYGPWSWNYNNIDLQYDRGSGKISENATIHELAHAWDSYYGYRMHSGYIREQSDIRALYNDLESQGKVKGLTIVEWFAGTSTEYYWHYLGMNTSEPSFAGWRDDMNDEEKARYVAIYEKYANIAKNDYAIAANYRNRYASTNQDDQLQLQLQPPLLTSTQKSAIHKRGLRRILNSASRD